MEGRAHILGKPRDARPVDVTAMKLADPGLVEEVPERAAGTAAEVEDSFPGEGPAFGKPGEDLSSRSSADFFERGSVADPAGQLERRERDLARHFTDPFRARS
jgi:hypothetical protein